MEEKNKRIILILAAVLIAALLLWAITRKPKPASGGTVLMPDPVRPAVDPITVITVPPVTPTVPVSTGGGGYVPVSTTSESYLPLGIRNPETKRLQEHLMSCFGAKLPNFGADGIFGNETIEAIGGSNKGQPFFPSIYQNVKLKKAISRNEFDTIMATKGRCAPSQPTTSGPLVDSYESAVATSRVKDLNDIEIREYIAQKTGVYAYSFTGNSMRKWAEALEQGKPTFYCSDCWIRDDYRTRDGRRA